MKKNLGVILFSIGLAAFTLYLALDTFVLRDVYKTNATQMNMSLFDKKSRKHYGTDHTPPQRKAAQNNSDGTLSITAMESNSTEADYEDENIRISLSEYTVNDTQVYVADVVLSSAQYLKTAFAEDTYGHNVTQTTSEIAASHGAILAINGDYYGAQERGYVIRNGIVYRDTSDDSDVLCIYADGHMEITDPESRSAEDLAADGVWQAFSFGPALIEDGEIAVSVEEEVGKARISNPRTAIGIIDDLHYVFVVSDGRTEENEGLSLYELAGFMESLHAETAYNLDGGGSSTMVFKNTVINQPTSNGRSIREREVSDIVYIG